MHLFAHLKPGFTFCQGVAGHHRKSQSTRFERSSLDLDRASRSKRILKMLSNAGETSRLPAPIPASADRLFDSQVNSSISRANDPYDRFTLPRNGTIGTPIESGSSQLKSRSKTQRLRCSLCLVIVQSVQFRFFFFFCTFREHKWGIILHK